MNSGSQVDSFTNTSSSSTHSRVLVLQGHVGGTIGRARWQQQAAAIALSDSTCLVIRRDTESSSAIQAGALKPVLRKNGGSKAAMPIAMRAFATSGRSEAIDGPRDVLLSRDKGASACAS